MPHPSPLEAPEVAAQAWARFTRLLRWMLLVTVALVLVAVKLVRRQAPASAVHAYIAVALGVALAMLLASTLMGLVFLRRARGAGRLNEGQPANPAETDQEAG